MSYFNTSEPLGLPRGSVRAILAIMLTGAVIAGWFFTGALPVELVGLDGMVLGYYFRDRQDSESKPVEGKLADPLVDG